MRIVLAIADDGARHLLHGLLVRLGHEVHSVPDGVSAWAVIAADDGPDVACVGMDVPGVEATELFRRIRAKAAGPRPVYVLAAGSRERQHDPVVALQAGADDVLWAPFDVRDVQGRLIVARRTMELRRTLAGLEDAVKSQTMTDALTGLLNHVAILDFLARELARAAREGAPVAVVLADVDRFKQINDQYGHESGDVVLREIGRRMRASVRSYDGIGRFGGDEFLLVLPRCEAKDAVSLGERIRASIVEAAVGTGLAKIPVSISIGVAAASRGDTVDPADLVRAADASVGKAKEAGRNRVAFVRFEAV